MVRSRQILAGGFLQPWRCCWAHYDSLHGVPGCRPDTERQSAGIDIVGHDELFSALDSACAILAVDSRRAVQHAPCASSSAVRLPLTELVSEILAAQRDGRGGRLIGSVSCSYSSSAAVAPPTAKLISAMAKNAMPRPPYRGLTYTSSPGVPASTFMSMMLLPSST